MKRWFKLILIIVVGVEFFILWGVSLKLIGVVAKNNARDVSVVALRKENLIYTPTENLKYFYESKPNSIVTDSASWLDDVVKYTINQDSLNERFDYSVEKPPHTFRIITLGDSFTFGHFVNTIDNWPEQLETKLAELSCENDTKFEVINLGERGYDAEYEVQKFKLRGVKYNPDLVLWFLHGDRWNELMTEKREEIESEYTKEERDRDVAEGDYSAPWNKALEYVYGRYNQSQLFEQQRAIFRRFTDLYQGQLVVLSLPESETRYKMRLRHFAQERPKTYYFDGLPYIFSEEMTYPDGHPSIRGHAEIAESIFQYVLKYKLLACH